MSIKMNLFLGEPDVTGPIITCDCCGEWIEEAKDGAYCYGTKFEDDSPIFTEIKFYHKDSNKWPMCMAVWDSYKDYLHRNGYLHGWMNLQYFLKYLSTNLAKEPK